MLKKLNLVRQKFPKFVIIPVLILLLLAPSLTSLAEAFSFPQRYDLIAILVEQGLYGSTDDYDGLSNIVAGPLKKTTVKERIDRYASDVQTSLPGTRAVIIQVDRFEKPENVTAVLERLYFDGDPKEPKRVAYLKGVVIIGEVPLPVVNKQGNRFVSLFPYTDFEQKAYVWNGITHDFEISSNNQSPQPEIWHGVIRPPVTTQNEDGKKLIAAYFDKNHLYHIGDARYRTFDKKVFFQDFFNEKKNLNAVAYKNYLNFLAHQSDISYLRYTKELLSDLSGPMEEGLANDVAEGKALTDELAAMGISSDSYVPKPVLSADAPQIAKDSIAGKGNQKVDKGAIPDIMTKIGKMSDSLMLRFNDVFTKYPNLINDFIKYTGRYSDVDTAVNLITAKDQYTTEYLHAVNTMVEEEIDGIVNQLQKDTILANVSIDVKNYWLPDPSDSSKTIGFPAVEVAPVSQHYTAEFSNFSPAYDSFPQLLNGLNPVDVTSVAQCTPYRGSQGIGAYSKVVDINRAMNMQTAIDQVNKKATGRTPEESAKDTNYQCHIDQNNNRGVCNGYTNFAGCFYNASFPYETSRGNSAICFPEHATDSVLDPAGTTEVKNPPAHFDDFNACLVFHEKDFYTDYLKSIDSRLNGINADPNKISQAIQGNPIKPSQRSPDSIQLFSVMKPVDAKITLGDLLRAMGWDSVANPNGWKAILGSWLTSPLPNGTQKIHLPFHPDNVKDVEVQLSRTTVKTISSVMYHKEPTASTLAAQAKNLISKDLPVDNPRYVTFQNQSGAVSRITYPDLFKATNLQDYTAQLTSIENQLNATARKSANDPAPCVNCLSTLISIAQDSLPTQANSSKVTDAISWRDMDIDAKHSYLLMNYLDGTRNPYVGKPQNGYELTYLNGEGQWDSYEFSVNPNSPKEDDANFQAAADEAKKNPEKAKPYNDDPDNPFDDFNPNDPAESAYDIITFIPPGSPWFSKIKEWSEGLKETVDPKQFTLDREKSDDKAELAKIKEESSTIESALTQGETPNLSKIRSLSLDSDSLTVVGNKKTNVTVTLKDKDGKIVSDEFTKVSLSVLGAGRFGSDVQSPVTMMSGREQYGVIADLLPTDAETGWIRIAAQIDGTEIKDEMMFTVVSEAKLVLAASTTGILANGKETTKIDISAQNSDGTVLTNISGEVKVAVSDPLMGTVQEKEVRLVSGKGSFTIRGGKKAGTLALNATMSSLDSGTLALKLLPGLPVKIALAADKDALAAVPGSFVNITATLYDANGNQVTTNSQVQVDFRVSAATNAFGTLSSASEKVKDGVAVIRLLPREQTGAVNIVAESKGLSTGILTVNSVKRFSSTDLSAMKPDSLVVALLGIPAGDVTQDSYLGGWFTTNGRTQAAVSVTAPVKQYKKLFEVNEHGAVNISDPSRISAQFIADNNFSVVLKDTATAQDIAKVTVFALKDGQFDVLDSTPANAGASNLTGVSDAAAAPDLADTLGDGIYLQKISPEEKYTVDKKKGAIRLVKSDQERMEVQTNGFVRIFDNDITLQPIDGKYLTIQVLDGGTPVANLLFVQNFNQDVRVTNLVQNAPGVYVQSLTQLPKIRYRSIFGGNSTSQGKGIAFFDTAEEEKGAGAPGFGFQSLEDTLDRFGVGFTQDNKFALLFSAGETVGEANRPYASDIGIVLGDPTVRVDNREPGSFSTDTGKLLYTGDSEVQALLNVDYNNDGIDDVLIAQEDGKVRLIQNNGGYDQLKDQGYLFEIKNGISDITKADVNNDGKMDIIIAAKESCRKDDTCIDIYQNEGAAFKRINLQIPQKEKVMTIRAEDLNNDQFVEIVFADTAGDIKVLYNRAGTFDRTPQIVGNVGLKADPTKNLITSVLLHYPGMSTKNPSDPASEQSYQTLSVKEQKSSPNPGVEDLFPKGLKEKPVADNAIVTSELDFIYADLDASAFADSKKIAEDLNGGVIKTGDRIRYTITLKNDSAALKKDVMVSDAVADQLEIDPSTILCKECAPGAKLKLSLLDGDATREYLFSGISIPAKSSRTISYEAVFKGETSTADKVNFIFNNEFDDADANLQALLHADSFVDIAVTKEGNPTGRVRYFYTTGIDNDRTLSWASELSSPPVPPTSGDLENLTGIPFPTPDDFKKTDPNGVPDIVGNQLNDIKNKDKDGDSLPDSLDDVSGALEDIAGATSALVSKLSCTGGCIPMPVNIAFLSPGFFSVLGVPAGFDQGLPVFGWGMPNPPYVAAGTPAMAAQGGRLYISPSLTGGIGFAVCMGTYGIPKNCYSFGINPLDLIAPGACDKIAGAMSGVLSTVSGAVGNANDGTVLSLGGGGSGNTVGSGSRRASGSGLGNYSLGSYDAPTTNSRNIRTPGFPSVITDWWARQMEEFTDKILNLPDIYLIYPQISSILGAFNPTQQFSKKGNLLTNILNYLNSLPILDIETQEVLFKIPIMTRDEIEKLKSDARAWIADEQAEIQKFGDMFGCTGVVDGATKNPAAGPDICRIVYADMNNLISSVTQNMQALDEWILFPKKLLQYRAIESYYLSQIIEYLDTIIQYSGGWIKKNTARLELWKAAVRTIKNTLGQWQGILDLMIDYNESCDKCRTERFSLKDLVMKLFVALPSPPVIPLPKLPDFVIDVSRVQAGIRVKWPDIKFQTTPLTLPRLPRIALASAGMSAASFKLSIPSIPKIPSPPNLPDLPSLPKLNLPKLPDIPPPPKIPGLPKPITVVTNVLKVVVKILCIIRMGLIPTDETLLKARIEEITARGLSPVIPIDTLFTVQSPTIPITYVDQLKITAYTNLQLNLNFIQKFVEDIATKANSFSTNLSGGINSFTDTLSKQIQKQTSPSMPVVPALDGRSLNYAPMDGATLNRELSSAFGRDMTDFVQLGMQMREAFAQLDTVRKENEEMLAQIPDSIRLDVSTEEFVPSPSHTLIASEDPAYLVLPVQQKLKQYRDSLVAYQNETDSLLRSSDSIHDLKDFGRYIAGAKSPFVASSLHQFLADSTVSDSNGSATSDPVNVGSLDLENIDWLAENPASTQSTQEQSGSGTANSASNSGRLLADLPAIPTLPTPGLLPGSPDPNGLPVVRNVGIFFVDPNGKSKRLVAYTLEADRKSSLSDIDIENDGDFDKLYSYGKNVFLKLNGRIPEKNNRPVFRPVDLEFWTIFELLPKGMSQNFPKVLSETAHESSLSFESSPISNVAGYEVIAKSSPYFFEDAAAQGNHASIRAHLLPDPSDTKQTLSPDLILSDIEGEVFVNGNAISQEQSQQAQGQAQQAAQMSVGDFIETKENSSVKIHASDGTTLLLSENTSFALDQGGPFTVAQGDLTVQIPKSGSLLFNPGEVLSTSGDGHLRMRFFDGSDVRLEPNETFTLIEIKPVIAQLSSLSGTAIFKGQKRDYITSKSGTVHVSAGETLHPLEVITVAWNKGAANERALTVSKDALIPVTSDMDIEVSGGMLEIIRTEKNTQPAAAGMALEFGDEITVAKGSASIKYGTGVQTTIPLNETFTLNKVDSLASPTLSLALDPAFYFTKVYAFDGQGNRSNSSEKLLLAPQVCGDKNPPIANFGKTLFQVAVSKTVQLDAIRSFDTEGKIALYQLDTDSTKDTNGDGIVNNDLSITNGEGNSVFTIGPFEKVGDIKMRLTVKDEAGNEGYQDITVQVITPRIVLEVPPLKSNIVQGFVEPKEANVPITIARFRPGPLSLGWEILKTITADADMHYFTDAGGKFHVEDLDLRDRLVVRNSKGEIAAEINPTTGRITITDDRYEKRMMLSIEPYLAPRIGVFLKTDSSLDRPLAYSYFVPDVNVDTTIDSVPVNYDLKALSTMTGVHVKPLQKGYDLGFKFTVLAAVDPDIPGAMTITKGNTRIAAVDVNADILVQDAQISVREKVFAATSPSGEQATELKDQPVVFELLYGKDVIAELFIAAHGKLNGKAQIVDFALATPVARPKVESPFTDVDPTDPFAAVASNLFKKGIIAGYPTNEKGKLLYKPDNQINRAEFTQITLKMLCIVPRPEAKKPPSPFYDVLDPKVWFYPLLKEGSIRGFIRGYLGEPLTDPETGVARTPFKPASNITRAEAVTVILAALQEEDVIDLSKADLRTSGDIQWYEPYIRIAQDLKPYLKDPQDSSVRSILITPEEAANPNQAISRRDFAIMADRVLLFYDCFKSQTSPRPEASKEKLSNKEGIFIARPLCNICPCYSSVGQGADLQTGDIIFAAITGKNGLPIYAKSNEERY